MEKLTPSRLAIYWPPWQMIRIQLLGTWTTVDKIKANIDLLTEYLKEHDTLTDRWRVINYMNATRMGFSGQGNFESEGSLLVAAFRDSVLVEYEQLVKKGEKFESYTPEQVLEAWSKLPGIYQSTIIRDLKKRLSRRLGDDSKKELQHFLELVGAIDAREN